MYTAFATVYDRLMVDVDYPAWAAFYETILSLYGIRGGKVCECACGTGSLTIPLAQKGFQMTGVDLSEEMLFEASQKARREGAPFMCFSLPPSCGRQPISSMLRNRLL